MRRILAVAVVVCVVLAGCGGGLEGRIVGKYKGKLDAAEKPTGMEGMAELVTLEMKEDKTFLMALPMMPMEGKWSLSGNTLTLNALKMAGQDATKTPGANKPLVMTVSDDGKTLTPVEQNGPKMTFVKE